MDGAPEMTTAAELDALRRLSASIGADPALTQAAGGNTSIKVDGIMWIKASGTWLAHARDRDIFVPIQLDRLREGMADDDPACETCVDYIDQTLNTNRLRPSVETTVHAVMPQRVVVHVHCVETISWAVRTDAEDVLAPMLKSFSWRFVPYARPGIPLARVMKERLKLDDDVVILGNHGLVVAAQSVTATETLLRQVVRALRRSVRSPPAADIVALAQSAQGSAYRLPDDPLIHGVATDPTSLAHASRGSLYPDHVVFLGPGVFVLARDEDLEQGMKRAKAEGLEPRIVLVPGKGVLVHRQSVAAVEPMARCLADVTARIDHDEPVHALSERDVDALVNWDAEKYRQSLARTG
jgi:rhamnose utilization protein RhaD (predicted bifunctional aldolase and dehydrogenase)